MAGLLLKGSHLMSCDIHIIKVRLPGMSHHSYGLSIIYAIPNEIHNDVWSMNETKMVLCVSVVGEGDSDFTPS